MGNNTPIDNFIVTSADPSDLSVPLLKQTSNPWQSQEYDTAHVWNPSNITIKAWGCAMTSAAMIFKYYGINKLPDGTARILSGSASPCSCDVKFVHHLIGS